MPKVHLDVAFQWFEPLKFSNNFRQHVQTVTVFIPLDLCLRQVPKFELHRSGCGKVPPSHTELHKFAFLRVLASLLNYYVLLDSQFAPCFGLSHDVTGTAFCHHLDS